MSRILLGSNPKLGGLNDRFIQAFGLHLQAPMESGDVHHRAPELENR